MTKDNLKGAFLFGCLMAVTGFLLMYFSVRLGKSRAEDWLAEQGGADTNTFLIIMENHIQMYIVTGGILFAVGLLLSVYAFYTQQN